MKRILKIKEMLKDAKISKRIDKLGNITFEPRNINPSQYNFYYKNGFEDCFDLVCIKCGFVECQCINKKQNKDKNNPE